MVIKLQQKSRAGTQLKCPDGEMVYKIAKTAIYNF